MEEEEELEWGRGAAAQLRPSLEPTSVLAPPHASPEQLQPTQPFCWRVQETKKYRNIPVAYQLRACSCTECVSRAFVIMSVFNPIFQPTWAALLLLGFTSKPPSHIPVVATLLLPSAIQSVSIQPLSPTSSQA